MASMTLTSLRVSKRNILKSIEIVPKLFIDKQVDISDYVPSNEWGLVGYSANRHVRYYTCCNEPYPDLTFTLNLKRVATFYHYVLILPCVLLSSLTLVIFWLPPESPAKILLGTQMTVFHYAACYPNVELNKHVIEMESLRKNKHSETITSTKFYF